MTAALIEHFLAGKVTLHCGDCLEVLAGLDACSIDSCVTDPPYHLTSIVKRFGGENAAPAQEGTDGAFARASRGFMGRTWDGGDVAFRAATWAAVYRVLKPGGYLLAFSGTRTYHRMACAIEDAGFEVRDTVQHLHETKTEYVAFEESLNAEQHSQFTKLFRERSAGCITWNYGAGFPKSRNITKDIFERCMCELPLRPDLQAPVSARSLLQQEMRGDREEDVTITKDLRDLPNNLDSKNSLSSRSGQDMLTGVCGVGNQPEEQGAGLAAQSESLHPVRKVRQGKDGVSVAHSEEADEFLLQSLVSSKGECKSSDPFREQRKGEAQSGQESLGREKPSLEGRGHIPEASRQLREREICEVSAGATDDGAGGRLRDGASPSDGEMDGPRTNADGVRSSSGSQTPQQRQDEFGTVAGQPQPQKRGAWDHCGRCGKPMVPDGLGTALKPAMELICMARKPLAERTVAANVLRWGTGAINVDGCRVGTEGRTAKPDGHAKENSRGVLGNGLNSAGAFEIVSVDKGRWPANVIHDGSEEVTAAFPESIARPVSDDKIGVSGSGESRGMFGMGSTVQSGYRDTETSAARFFYSAKADADDRLGSRHPTIKPVDLMQYLVRLVTPKGGVVLDPFSGTGTTGEAAWREGMRAVLVEAEPEYQTDIRRRMALVLAGPDERVRESIKARGTPIDYGPLFAALREAAE